MSRVNSDEDTNERLNPHSNDDAESESSNYNNERKKKNKKRDHSLVQKSDYCSPGNGTGAALQNKDRKIKEEKVDNVEAGLSSKECDDEMDGVKLETLSDEINSAMSDINPPSFSTRLRRRGERRQFRSTTSSRSSASDGRKTKSEPLLITIESDSEDDVSVSTNPNRLNRTARIQGEFIRKMGRLSHLPAPNYKGSESSSKSEDEEESEDEAKRKKSKKKSKVLSTKSKKSLSGKGGKKKHLKPKRSFEAHIPSLYSGRKETRRLKIRSLRKRFERKKNEKSLYKRPNLFLRAHSPKNILLERRRIPRRCSVVSQGSYCEDNEPEKVEAKIERRGRPKKKSRDIGIKDESAKKNVEESNIEDDIRKIVNAPKLNLNDKNTKSTHSNKKHSDGKNIKANSKTNSEDDSKINLEHEKVGKDTEAFEDKETEDNLNKKMSDDLVLDNTQADAENIQSDLDRIKINKPDLMKDANSDEYKKKRKEKNRLGGKSKSHKKSKIKSPIISGIIRRRGRPRLTESSAKVTTPAIPYYSIKPQVPFLQNSFCFDVSPKLSKCRECRIALYRNSRRMYNSYCRFMEYRKLCYNKNGIILSAGFATPSEATAEHLSIWLPHPENPPKDLNYEAARSLVGHIGDQFCDLVEQEKEALSLHVGLHQVITWKRLVQGVREMCDVCSTTIFNIHWVCPICGFAVCIDCYKVRKLGIVDEPDEEQPKDRDEFKWLLCTLRQPHQQDSLVITQIIPGDALWILRNLLHNTRDKLNIPSYCKCSEEKTVTPNKSISTGINKQIMSCVTQSFPPSAERVPFFNLERNLFKNNISNYDDLDIEVSGSALKWIERTSINSDFNLDYKNDENFGSFEDLKLLMKGSYPQENSDPDKETANFSLDDIMASFMNCQDKTDDKSMVKHFNHRYPQPNSGRDPLPIRIYTKIESELSFSSVPHMWYCNGRLLFLMKADHPENLALFQEQWKRGQPIIVKGVDEQLNMNLWHPDGFCRDFGEVKNDLVDCKTGAILKNLPMKKFWEGFENFSKRLTDENGDYMLLKLKDWPPGEDFSEKLPRRFEDLMKGLPLPEYTHRDGILNLAGRLPSSFVRPDLGPKMYNAYGSALYPAKGTTNLHLDVSDAVNVMVYVGIPSDGNALAHIEEALKAIDEGGCDSLMRSRVRNRNTRPGALWHIYNARDADKIRDMLTKVGEERGEKIEANHDPIHDQSWYIDSELRQRLYREYGVEGYAIAQCLGDAVFIPAGAPHQVRNLHSCVKVAEDFVSPENIAHCFKLTQEFRNLSDTHTNHEDKLQIKNIIYHVVRDSLSYLIPKDWTPPLPPQSFTPNS